MSDNIEIVRLLVTLLPIKVDEVPELHHECCRLGLRVCGVRGNLALRFNTVQRGDGFLRHRGRNFNISQLGGIALTLL